MPHARSFHPIRWRQPLILLLFLWISVSPAMAQDSHQILVQRSDGTPVASVAGMEVRGYAGSSWRETGTFEGQGLFSFLDPAVTTARIILNGISSDSVPLGQSAQLVDFAVQVLKSPQAGGGGRNVNEVRLYQGSTWRANLAQSGAAGEYHIDVVDGVDLRAHVIKDGLGQFTDAVRPVDSDAIDTQFQLVDFAVQVLKSPQAGGGGRNVNEVRLYQGSTWRANLAQSGAAGEYHIDVVDGVDLRAYCILEGLGAFGSTVRPADSAERDDTMQLVDFFIALDSQDCQAVPLSEVRLYQGNTWRGNFSFASPVRELHHDVVPGVEVRAWLSRSGIGTFTAACTPGTRTDQPDLILAAPTVRFDPLDGASQARLYEGNTHRMTLNRAPEGDFSVVLVEGMSGLRFWISSAFSPEFAVSNQSGILADDGTSLVQSTVDTCWEPNDDVAATVLTDLVASPGATGLIELSWTLLDGHSFVLFHLQRDGTWLNTSIPVAAGIREYRFVDPEPAVGLVSWRIWGEELDGTQQLLAELTSQALPESFELLGAWPNPFNPDTRLRLSLDRERDIQLSVYNLQGALVSELHRGILPAGMHDVTFSGTGLSSGVYLVRLQSGDAQRSMKVMLVK